MFYYPVKKYPVLFSIIVEEVQKNANDLSKSIGKLSDLFEELKEVKSIPNRMI